MKRLSLIIIVLFLLFGCNNKKDDFIEIEQIVISFDTKGGILNEEVIVVNKSSSPIFQEPIKDDNIFLGWCFEDGTLYNNQVLNEDTSFYAKWFRLNVEYTITYRLNSGKFSNNVQTKYTSGIGLVLPIPEKKFNEFEGWYLDSTFTNKITSISDKTEGSIIVYAKWIDVAEYKKITYDLDGGIGYNLPEKYIETIKIPLGRVSKEGYIFKGWYLDSDFTQSIREIDETITDDLKLYAKFVEAKLENATVSFLGDSITTYENYIPQGYATYYPASTVDDVSDTWWYQVVEKTKMTLVKNNSYSGSRVSGDKDNATKNLSRLMELKDNNIYPDIIIIHMGTNDLSQNASLLNFQQSYIKMIELLKEYFYTSDIFVCTLPSNSYPYAQQQNRPLMNEIILELALKYELKVIDLTKVITEENKDIANYGLVHPNDVGMTLMADETINELRKYYK